MLASCAPARVQRGAHKPDPVDEFIAAPFWDRNAVAPIVRMIREGAIEEAADALVSTPQTPDPSRNRLIRELLIGLGRWEDLRILVGSNASAGEVLRALSQIPPEQYLFRDNKSTARLALSNANTPTIEVDINGSKHFFWLDTGTGISVLGSDLAEKLGIKPVTQSKVFVRSVTGRLIDAYPAVLPVLRTGALEARNHHVLIIDTRQLQVESMWGLLKVFRIEGILGWNFIQHVDVEMDLRAKKVTLRKPGKPRRTNRNVLWLGWPYIVTRGPDGSDVMLGFDTGSTLSFVTPEFTSSVGAQIVGYRQTSLEGVGGVAAQLVGIANSVPLQIAGQKLMFDSISVHAFDIQTLLRPSGVLGADVLQWGKLRLDWSQGRVTIQPYTQPHLILRSTTNND